MSSHQEVWYHLADGAVLGVGFSNWTERADYEAATQGLVHFDGEVPRGNMVSFDQDTGAITYLWTYNPVTGTIST
jgi:hypothetical protein